MRIAPQARRDRGLSARLSLSLQPSPKRLWREADAFSWEKKELSRICKRQPSQARAKEAMHSAGRNLASSWPRLGSSISVVRNSPVETSSKARPSRPGFAFSLLSLSSPVLSFPSLSPSSIPSSRTTAARKLLLASSSMAGSMMVPGVTTRVISLFTRPRANLGSSTWSQMATLCPARMSLAR